jgi:hypothetical protein
MPEARALMRTRFWRGADAFILSPRLRGGFSFYQCSSVLSVEGAKLRFVVPCCLPRNENAAAKADVLVFFEACLKRAP